jgi:Cu-Zn family superoxide dismutase
MSAVVRTVMLAALAVNAGTYPLQPGRQPTPPVPTAVSATFAPYAMNATAITYDQKGVPEGAKVAITTVATGSGQVVELRLTGLNPNRTYGAHVHTQRCGASGSDAGPHYQYQADPAATPAKPSTDPGYANPRNEVWLDFTTNAEGVGTATASHEWLLDPNHARSLVIHSQPTKTGPGEAGTAGDRLACVNLVP